ncbi:hypothetical protein ACQKIE_12515 [Luteibacter sp. NPDC031894]|uniref:hypothetical protein n=1 Tax=Luteibacter sp. NPDC031894 TaxID=3390572 RepID=UPI003D018DF1
MNTIEASSEPTASAESASPPSTLSRPVPGIVEAINGTVDLATLGVAAHVSVAGWPGAVAGNHVWLEVHGTGGNHGASVILLSSHPLTASEVVHGLHVELPRSWLETLNDGSVLTVQLWACFGDQTERDDAEQFPEGPFTLRKGILIDFEDLLPQAISAGKKVILAGGAASMVSSKDGMSIVEQHLPPYLNAMCLAVKKKDVGADIRGALITLARQATSFQLGIKADGSVQLIAGSNGWTFRGVPTGQTFGQSNVAPFNEFRIYTNDNNPMTLIVDNLRFS